MDQEKIPLTKSKSYTVVDLCQNRFFDYKDSYDYYDIDVNNILIFKKSNNKHFIRCKDVNKMTIVPLKLKIKKNYYELRTYENNDRIMFIHSDDKELFRKCREI